MRRSEVFGAIDIERGRQDRKFPGQWRALAGAQCTADKDAALAALGTCLGILMEEVGEVAKAIIEGDFDNVTTELVQVAAVCTAWLEGRPT